jgi:hypothetical protein
MDQDTLKELNARADAAAGAEGAGASVTVEDLMPSEVRPVGLRITLTVFAIVGGVLREEGKSYRPDREDLGAVLERDAREMARGLFTVRY